ncbi:MAG: hypothetical protein ACRCTX_26330 [Afipia sp.]
MTISSTTRKAGPYTGNDATTVFPFAFKVFSASDILVVRADDTGAETVLTLNSDYNVGLNANQDSNPGGSVTLPAALASTLTLTITSAVQNLQPTDLTNNGAFFPKVLNTTFDRIVIQIQQLAESLGRSLKTSVSTPDGVDPTLPTPVPYQLIGWNATGTGLQNTDPTYSTALATDLASSSAGKGSKLVRFIQRMTGAVSRWVEDKLSETVSVKDFGAVGDGVTNDAAAVATAVAAGVAYVPPGTTKTDSLPSGDYRLFSFGGSFSGEAALDSQYPAFGPGVGRFIAVGGHNSLIGIAYNNKAANTAVFPAGVTGYGRADNAGNQVFGLFGRADLYASSGVATNEYNSFNYGGSPSSALPPDRSFGTAQSHPIAVTVAAGGNYNSSIGIHVCREGSAPQSFLAGAYFSPDACVNYGLFIDATNTSTHVAAVLRHAVSKIGLQVQGSGTPVAANEWLTYTDGASVVRFGVKQDGRMVFTTGITQSTHGVAGAAETLPSNPSGYLQIEVGGYKKIIPYYEP